MFEPEIFKFIPKNEFFDFSMDLFPLLMKNKKKIYGYAMDEYWTDIGNIFEYKKGVFDALDGKLKIVLETKSRGSKYISSNAKIDKSAKVCEPCFVGNNVVIGKNAVIEPYSVISDNVTIGTSVSVGESIIWENSKIDDNVKITNTIIGRDTLIPGNITLFDSIMMEYSNR